jgi:hypothetical protein
MGQAFSIYSYTQTYYSGLFHYIFGSGRHSPYSIENKSTIKSLQIDASDSSDVALFKQHARIHLFSLASNFYLYDKPHYRKGSYRDDLIDNLRNVAIPGTGVPLSIFARSKVVALGFLLTAYPAVSFAASIHKWITSKFQTSISKEYSTRLLVNTIRYVGRLFSVIAFLNDKLSSI